MSGSSQGARMSGAWRGRAAEISAWSGVVLLASSSALLHPGFRAVGAGLRPGLRVCLVDLSESARRRVLPSSILAVMEREAREASAAKEDVCVIGFGAQVARAFGPGPPAVLSDALAHPPRSTASEDNNGVFSLADEARLGSFFGPDFDSAQRQGATRLAAALQLAAQVLRDRPRAPGRIVLLWDRTYTGTDPRPWIAELREQGASFESRELPPAQIADLGLGELRAPREIEAGAPLVVAADVFYEPGAAGTPFDLWIDLERENNGRTTTRREKLAVPEALVAGEDGSFSWPVRFDLGPAQAGRIEVRARVHLSRSNGADGPRVPEVTDAMPENDASTVEVRCGTKLVIGVVGEELTALLSSAVREKNGPDDAGFELWPLDRESVPGALADIDALVASDVPATALPAELLSSFVQRGGGFLALIGPEFITGFGRDAARGPDEPASLLPLQPAGESSPTREIVLVVDNSGSMAGAAAASVRSALASLLEVAPRRAAIEVAMFSGELAPPIAIQRPGDRRAPSEIRRELVEKLRAAGEPRGPTALFKSLEELAARCAAEPHERLVFLLSDGRDVSEPDAAARGARIRERLAAARAVLAVIAAGEDADEKLLASLVPAGQALLEARAIADPVRGAEDLRRLFERELSKDRVREGEALPVRAARDLDPSSLGSQVLGAQLRSPESTWPRIRRYARARAADGSEVLWRSDDGDPLLALQRVGLGVTAACAFAPIDGWAESWRARGDLFAPLVRALARAKMSHGPRLVERDGELVLEDLPIDAPAVLEARVFEVDAPVGGAPLCSVRFSASGVAGDPRSERRAAWPPELDDAPGPAPVASSRDTATARDLATSASLELAIGRRLRAEVRGARSATAPGFVLELSLQLQRAPEFRRPVQRLTPLDVERAAEPTAPPEHEIARAHPSAPFVLLAGLVLLALAAVLGLFEKRVARARGVAPGSG